MFIFVLIEMAQDGIPHLAYALNEPIKSGEWKLLLEILTLLENCFSLYQLYNTLFQQHNIINNTYPILYVKLPL